MGRLFWKLFATLFVAQILTVGGVGSLLWLRHLDESRQARASLGVEPGPPGPLFENADDFRPPGPPRFEPSADRERPDARGGPPDDDGPPGSFRGPRWPDGAPRLPTGLPPGAHAGDLPVMPISVGLVASLVLAFLLARYLSRPIVALSKAFEDVAQGRLEPNLSAQMGRRRDELADLGRQFDGTARQINGLLGQHRRLLHDVSHELRSPLARIQLAIDLARQQPEKLPTLVERIERESQRIDRLIEELLTLSRLEAQPHLVREDEVDLAELIGEIVADARFEAQAKGALVELHGDAQVVVTGHAELLHRAIENVVRNAVRYTFDRTTVNVTLTVRADGVSISVCDEGPGIAEGALAAIFEPFVRLPDQQAGHGYGLGLAITKRVVAAHDGSISASNRESGGLCIEIALPKARSAQAPGV